MSYFNINISGLLLLFPERRRLGKKRDPEGPEHLVRERFSSREEKGAERGC